MTEKQIIERNLGEQPLAALMAACELKAHDLVSASPVPISHKLIARACKGRRLTRHSQMRVLVALNRATGKSFGRDALFTY